MKKGASARRCNTPFCEQTMFPPKSGTMTALPNRSAGLAAPSEGQDLVAGLPTSNVCPPDQYIF